jgi:hypothetical protein
MNIEKRFIKSIEIICLISIVTIILSGCSDIGILDLKPDPLYKELLNDPDHDPLGQEISLYKYPEHGNPDSIYDEPTLNVSILAWYTLPGITYYSEEWQDGELKMVYYFVNINKAVFVYDNDLDGIIDEKERL